MAPIDQVDLRRRPKHARYSQRQLDRAWTGELNRDNTRQESTARSAVYRVEAVRRLLRAESRGFSPGQALGHPRSGEQPISATVVEWAEVTTTQGIVDLTLTTNRVASRVGRYQHDVQALLENRFDPKAFQRYWRGHVRSAGGYELEADPDRVLALIFLNGPGPIDRYRRLQPGPAK